MKWGRNFRWTWRNWSGCPDGSATASGLRRGPKGTRGWTIRCGPGCGIRRLGAVRKGRGQEGDFEVAQCGVDGSGIGGVEQEVVAGIAAARTAEFVEMGAKVASIKARL